MERLRLAVYRGFARDGRAPGIAELAEEAGLSPDQVRDGLRSLHEQRHLVLHDEQIVMAHPFSAVPLGFAVMGPRTLWWGGCSWDSFALSGLLDCSVLVSTNCPGCWKALAWNVHPSTETSGAELAYFPFPVAQMWDDVLSTCGNQRIFCGQNCLDEWLERTGSPRGYVTNLQTLWRLASRWYEGRLSSGYVRREPSEAKAYFASCGLKGPFWGLPA